MYVAFAASCRPDLAHEACLAEPALVDIDYSLLEQVQLEQDACVLLALDKDTCRVGLRMQLLGPGIAESHLSLEDPPHTSLADLDICVVCDCLTHHFCADDGLSFGEQGFYLRGYCLSFSCPLLS